MSYQSINSSEIIAGQPVKESLVERIVENLDFHEAQIASLGASGGQTTVFNQIIKFPEVPVGAAIWTWDTIDNSQSQGLSKQWVDCAGSGSWTDGAGISRTTPDARNRFLRMFGLGYNSVATDLIFEDSTKRPNSDFLANTSANGKHTHKWYDYSTTTTGTGGGFDPFISWVSNAVTYDVSGNEVDLSIKDPLTGNYVASSQVPGASAVLIGSNSGASGQSDNFPIRRENEAISTTFWTGGANNSTTAGNDHAHTVSIYGGGDYETAPKNIELNLIFKKAYTWGSFRLLYKASATFTVTTVNLTKIEAATAASVATLDIRKATTAQLSSGSGDTSLLSSLATITDDGSTNFVEASGTIKTDGTEDIATNEWIYAEFTAKIKGASEYHIQVVGS